VKASDEFLIAFHRQHPGCTSEAYADGRVEGGGSSYDLLVDCLPGGSAAQTPVLDLGCGDGHLLQLLAARGFDPSALSGVDMSPDELCLARARPALARARLHLARGDALPLADGSVRGVLSHLAFMLMSDAEAVVGEVVRVLQPGGVFATVVGGGPKVGDAFELFLDLLMPRLLAAGSSMPKLGDPRCRKEEGLGELLGAAAGFVGPPRIDDFKVDLSGRTDRVWRTLSTLYNLHDLPAASMEQLRRDFEPAGLALGEDGETVPCSMFVRRVVAIRR
jgi:SAM-dependent methyltransferase